jgi:hypothetical protein
MVQQPKIAPGDADDERNCLWVQRRLPELRMVLRDRPQAVETLHQIKRETSRRPIGAAPNRASLPNSRLNVFTSRIWLQCLKVLVPERLGVVRTIRSSNIKHQM